LPPQDFKSGSLSMLDTYGIFALVYISVVLVGAVCLVVWLGSLPARIARRRQHPQVDAINAMGWLGLILTGGIGWGLALIWALVRHDSILPTTSKTDAIKGTGATYRQLESRIAKLEQILAGINGPKGKS
jgi:hypothetical protein